MNNATNFAANYLMENYINGWRSHLLTRNPVQDGIATMTYVDDAIIYKFHDGSTITLTPSQAGGWEAFVNSNTLVG